MRGGLELQLWVVGAAPDGGGIPSLWLQALHPLT